MQINGLGVIFRILVVFYDNALFEQFSNGYLAYIKIIFLALPKYKFKSAAVLAVFHIFNHSYY